MIEKRALIGNTVKLMYNWYSTEDGITPADVSSPVIKVYDYNRVQIGTSVTLDNSNKSGTGSYFYMLVIPNNPPYIDVECTVLNGSIQEVTRDHIILDWTENDINDLPAIALSVGTNTYISLSDYISTLLNSATWDSTSDNDKSKALIQATRNIDKLNFKGSKATNLQKLQFPRIFNYNPIYEGLYTNLELIEETVEIATCEEALAILENFITPNTRIQLQQQGVKSISFGNASESYTGAGSARPLYSVDAKNTLKPFISYVAEFERKIR